MNRFTRCIAGLLLVAVLTPGAATGPGPSGRFEIGAYGHILVPVSIDGGPARIFAIDTAASHTVLDRSTFNDRVPAGPASAGGTAHGAHGTLTATVTRLDSVSLWEDEVSGVDAVLLPVANLAHGGPPDFDGVLGIPYLSRFLIDIDFPNRTLALRDRGDAAACDVCQPEDAVALDTLMGGLKGIRLVMDGVPMIAVLDTGAARSVLNPAAAGRLQSSRAEGLEVPPMAAITIGSRLVAHKPRPDTIALPVFATLGLDEEPAMILGLDILASGRLVLDLAGAAAWFLPHGPAGDT